MHRFNLNKHFTLLFLLLAAMPLVLQAQTVLNGKVVDAQGNAVPHATVWLAGLAGEVADEQGKFSLAKLPKDGQIKISAVGFETIVANWPAGETTATFSLTAAISDLETVVVTGSFEPQSAKQSVYQVRTISSEVIQNRAPSNIQEVLNTELGIRFSQDNALGSSNLELLGMSGQNVKILIDGIPMVGRQGTSNEININQIDINRIERVEIVEGPMSVVYGADALAGVINIITKSDNPEKFNVKARIQEESVGNEYSAFDGKGTHIRSVTGSYRLKNWDFGASFSQNNFGGWKGEKTGRDYEWLPKEQNFFNLKTGWGSKSLNLEYQLDFLDETVFAYGPEARLEILDQEFITSRWMHRLSGRWDTNSKFGLIWQGAFTDYSRESQTWVSNVRTGEHYQSQAPGANTTIDYKGFSWRMIGDWKIADSFKLQPGIDLNTETGSGERIEENEGIQDYAVFLSGEWTPFNAIKIKPGIRKNWNSAYDAPALIPSLNTKFVLNENLDLRLAYANGFRAPSIRELYFNFFDASHSITGNPDLKAETSNSFNGSLDWKAQINPSWKISTVLGAFYNDVKDRIAYGQDPSNIQVTTLFNVERYKTTGFTLNHTESFKNLSANVGFSYIGRYNLLSEEQTIVPEMSWTPEVNTNLTYQFLPWKTTATLYYKWTGALPGYETVADSNGNPSAREIMLDGYHWMDISFKKDIGGHLSVNAGARNMLDVKQISSTSSGGDAHGTGPQRPVGYGRSYFLGLTYQLNK
ncbi:outer membrane receptor for ferrienterochelin and colicins [Algoriphagus sp. 4150]|uniref:TonB-dependent receptor n=1 Tax=Algoriphagus sp. 4150 TaxID=2817756 RepID=UPI00285F4AB4|nr:TonB-dependent receptor [Algoriphagus sp. 4150]MDR7129923.1 outer membrane receptor for ferrienterochelin and colicins [Algoriphagus sp. 4150]